MTQFNEKDEKETGKDVTNEIKVYIEKENKQTTEVENLNSPWYKDTKTFYLDQIGFLCVKKEKVKKHEEKSFEGKERKRLLREIDLQIEWLWQQIRSLEHENDVFFAKKVKKFVKNKNFTLGAKKTKKTKQETKILKKLD